MVCAATSLISLQGVGQGVGQRQRGRGVGQGQRGQGVGQVVGQGQRGQHLSEHDALQRHDVGQQLPA
eukprot:CAMPEP_0173281380 /NCGR_PEP_ID=MMETSP1143-20121109/6201_1 /TAXON_ID=483371 /ORGANISM="non described non described, Strain CCMP2298" /LENGTH=66 /DNA_ID=CAMNT_0014218771 /DNA_START=136 /DNA_END=334 /DNA_ORIENTATION=+